MAKVKCFRCARTGVLFPPDYVELWGIKYGFGLGPTPVSEAVHNMYERQPAAGRDGTLSHPIAQCRAQVDLVEVEEEEYEVSKAILNKDDRDFRIRGELMHHKGLAKEGSYVSQRNPEKVEASRTWLKNRETTLRTAFAARNKAAVQK